MERLARRMLRGCMAATILCSVCAIGLTLGPCGSAAVAGTITSGIVNLGNAAGTAFAGATPGTVSTTGDIATAQAFQITGIRNVSTVSLPGTEYFYGLSGGKISIASVPFEFTGSGPNTSVTMTSTLFGTFQSSFAVQVQNDDNGFQKTRVFDFYGLYTSGTIAQMPFPGEVSPRGNTDPSPVEALWRVTLTQQDQAGSTINFGSTFSFPVPVPEPGTSAMAVSGIVLVAAGYASRRRRAARSGKPSS